MNYYPRAAGREDLTCPPILTHLDIASGSVALCKCVLQPLGVQACIVEPKPLLSEDGQRSTSMGKSARSAE
jgi:hypothetical protein